MGVPKHFITLLRNFDENNFGIVKNNNIRCKYFVPNKGCIVHIMRKLSMNSRSFDKLNHKTGQSPLRTKMLMASGTLGGSN